MVLGDVVNDQGEKYEIAWIYNETNIEIKPLNNYRLLPKIIPIHISELDKVNTVNFINLINLH